MLQEVNSGFSTQEALMQIGGRNAFIVIDEAVQTLHKAMLEPLLSSGQVKGIYPVRGGEDAKQFSNLGLLLDQMIASALHRDDVLVAIGGGVTTDLSGLAASLMKRGMPWIGIPTTLLGMIDAAIGGKTAVNMPQGKNLVGTFHLPESLIIDPHFLMTLPEREWVNGLGEYVKYGFIANPALLENVLSAEMVGKSWHAVVLEGIATCVDIKTRIVAKDLTETGDRMVLNFGHTLGHCLERHFDYHRYAHGEAVLYGIAWALKLSVTHAGLPQEVLTAYLIWLKGQSWYEAEVLKHPQWFLSGLWQDKKIRSGQLQFVLISSPGKPMVVKLAQEAVEASLKEGLNL